MNVSFDFSQLHFKNSVIFLIIIDTLNFFVHDLSSTEFIGASMLIYISELHKWVCNNFTIPHFHINGLISNQHYQEAVIWA